MFGSQHIVKNDDVRLETLKKFYKNKKYLTTFIEIVTGTHQQKKLSLRMFDWVATNYTKKNNVMYKLSDNGPLFDVHNDYQAQLKAFTKKNFDPFCSNDRILYKYNKGGVPTYIQTTIAQLNFFKWAISYKVVNYVLHNFDVIFKDMNDANKRQRRESERYRKNMNDANKRRKRESERISKNVDKSTEEQSDSDESSSSDEEDVKSEKKSSAREYYNSSSSDSDSDDEVKSEKKSSTHKYYKSSSEDEVKSAKKSSASFSFDSELTTPAKKINILEFTSTNKKPIKKRKTMRKPRQKLSASNSKDINRCKANVIMSFT